MESSGGCGDPMDVGSSGRTGAGPLLFRVLSLLFLSCFSPFTLCDRQASTVETSQVRMQRVRAVAATIMMTRLRARRQESGLPRDHDLRTHLPRSFLPPLLPLP